MAAGGVGKTEKPNFLIISVARASKWRLPTEQETVAAAGAYSWGAVAGLNCGTFGGWNALPAAGQSDGVTTTQNIGAYWTSMAANGGMASHLFFDQNIVPVQLQPADQHIAMPVRCVIMQAGDALPVPTPPVLPDGTYVGSTDYRGSNITFSTQSAFYPSFSWTPANATWFHPYSGNLAVASPAASSITSIVIDPWLLNFTDNVPAAQTRQAQAVLSTTGGVVAANYLFSQTSPTWSGWSTTLTNNMSYAAANYTISVATNMNWSIRLVAPDGSQQTLTPTNGVVTVPITSNTTPSTRTWQVFLTCDGLVGYTNGQLVGSYTQVLGANILYIAADGTLSTGSWGSEITNLNQMFYAKFGSIVGLTIGNVVNDPYDPTDIVWNPTNTPNWANYVDIPVFTGTEDATNYPATSGTILDIGWSSAARLQAGLGDPCRLVGLTASQMQVMNTAGTLKAYVDASIWRTPTNADNVAFVGTNIANTPIGDYYDVTGRWEYVNLVATNMAEGIFVKQGNTRLPAAGNRHTDGKSNSPAFNGHYWTSVVDSSISGSTLGFYFNRVSAQVGLNSAFALPVRCVPK